MDRLDRKDSFYQYVLESTTDAVFEIDAVDFQIKLDAQKIDALFGFSTTEPDAFSVFQQIKGLAHPHDAGRLTELYSEETPEELFDIDAPFSVDFRVRNPLDVYFWVNCTIVPIPGPEGMICKYVGYFKNIDEQKRYERETQRRARMDSLTKLYNKAYTEERINKYLENVPIGKKEAALFVIDVDDFKQINDTLGHLLGDAVLCDLGEKLKSLCRASDVVGRIGGDEFIVFLQDLPSGEIARQKAVDLISVFRQIFLNQKNEISFSGSIGVSRYPQDGLTYTELFENADKALYCAKIEGKNQYRFYDPEMPQRCYVNMNKAVIDNPNALPTQIENISRYIFQTLYETSDLEIAIQTILGIVGRQFHVSRAYVFENTLDNLACVNTFEWCMDGIAPEKENLQYIPYSQLDEYPSNFNKNGVFYCTDISKLSPAVYAILEPQQISSMLQCAVREDDVFSGYVGFDECSGKRFWTQQEVETLTLIAQVLSTFLLKKRSQEKMIFSKQRLERMMDQLDLFAYVIEPATYRILFLNEKTLEIAPDAQIGDLCYRSLRGKDAPCADCPISLLMRTGETSSLEIYNDLLDVWTKATASFFEWENQRKAVLISCFDISQFKKQ